MKEEDKKHLQSLSKRNRELISDLSRCLQEALADKCIASGGHVNYEWVAAIEERVGGYVEVERRWCWVCGAREHRIKGG